MSEKNLVESVGDFAVVVDGKVDLVASVERFEEFLAKYAAKREADWDVIGAAVDAVFDRFRGSRLNAQALFGFVIQDPSLKVDNKNFGTIKENFDAYMKENTDKLELKDRKTKKVIQKAEPWGTKKFHTSKGRNGGIVRVSDHAEPIADETDTDE